MAVVEAARAEIPALIGDVPPIEVGFAPASRQARWSVLLRPVLVLPADVVTLVLAVISLPVLVAGWLGALVLGRLPRFAHAYLSGYLRWYVRVTAYTYLLTDRYPPFAFEDVDYPVRTELPPPVRLNRLAVLFRLILVLPVQVVSYFAGLGAACLWVIWWLVALVMGRLPEPVHQALAAVVRYQARVTGYYFLLTPEYPGGLYGDLQATAPWGRPPGVGGSPNGSGPVGFLPPLPDPVLGPAGTQADVFTYAGPTYAWGYAQGRRFCGVWRRSDPVQGEVWPIAEQQLGWQRFRDLEPEMIDLHDAHPPFTPLTIAFAWPSPAPMSMLLPAPLAFRPPAPPAPAAPPAAAARPGAALVLSTAAKRLVSLMLVLGIAAIIALAVVSVRHHTSLHAQPGGIQPTLAAQEIGSAYHQKQTAFSTTVATATCGSQAADRTCRTGADVAAPTAVDSLATTLRHPPVPSGAPAAAACASGAEPGPSTLS